MVIISVNINNHLYGKLLKPYDNICLYSSFSVTIFKSDLCVCLTDGVYILFSLIIILLKFSGWVHRITWEGEVLFSFRICDIPFTIDQSQERSSKLFVIVIHLRFNIPFLHLESQQTMSPFMHATDAV